LDLLDFWIFGLIFSSFLQRWIKMQLVVKAAVKWVILLIGYSVFLKHKYIVGR